MRIKRYYLCRLIFVLLLAELTACGGGGSGSSSSSSSSGSSGSNSSSSSGGGGTPRFGIGGGVSGLIGSGLVLQNNGTDDLSITVDGEFTFATRLENNADYHVTVTSQPIAPNQVCRVMNGDGIVSGAPITNVLIECENVFSVGGTVSGLTSPRLTLSLNSDEMLSSVSSDGSFNFPMFLSNQAVYDISIYKQPWAQICEIENASGFVAGADVINIQVECKDRPDITAVSHVMKVELLWGEPGPVDIIYSTDPDCDWDNYASCPEGTLLPGLMGGSLFLDAIANNLRPNSGLYFALVNSEGMRSEVKGARLGAPSFNGSVEIMAKDEERIYLGGSFTRVGPPVDHGVILTADKKLTGALPEVLGANSVRVAVADGRGGWYVGGDFMNTEGQARGLARIRADGSVDTNWDSGIPGFAFNEVNTLVISGDTLYAGGKFSQAGGQDRENLAVFNIDTGALKDWDAGVSDTVYALTIIGDTVYAGGRFFQANGQSRRRLAAFAADTGELRDWNPGAGGEVRTLASSGDVIYAGGFFENVGENILQGGYDRFRLAALDAETARVLDWDPGANPLSVWDISVYEDTVYVGGVFDGIAGENRDSLAAFDAVTGQLKDWSPVVSGGGIFTLTPANGLLYVGGEFSSINGERRANLAAFDLETGELTDWNPDANRIVRTIEVSEGAIYAGGEFTQVGGLARSRLASIELDTGLITDWNPGADSVVTALAVSEGIVYAGGDFTYAGGESRNRLAAFDAVTGELNDWNPEANGLVWVIAVTDDNIYAGGMFTEIGSMTRTHLAAFDKNSGELDFSWNPQISDYVKTMILSGNTLYAGGAFTEVDGVDRFHLAAFDAVTGELDLAWNAWTSFNVYALSAADNTVYVGGGFTMAGGEDRWSLAAFDASTGTLKDWHPWADDSVIAMDVHNGNVYAGGRFTSFSLDFRTRLASFDPVTGALSNWNPRADSYVFSLIATDDIVYVGGIFENIGNRPRRGFAAIRIDSGELFW